MCVQGTHRGAMLCWCYVKISFDSSIRCIIYTFSLSQSRHCGGLARRVYWVCWAFIRSCSGCFFSVTDLVFLYLTLIHVSYALIVVYPPHYILVLCLCMKQPLFWEQVHSFYWSDSKLLLVDEIWTVLYFYTFSSNLHIRSVSARMGITVWQPVIYLMISMILTSHHSLAARPTGQTPQSFSCVPAWVTPTKSRHRPPHNMWNPPRTNRFVVQKSKSVNWWLNNREGRRAETVRDGLTE